MNQTPEYRPCVITESREGGRNEDGEFIRDDKRFRKALFHFWSEHHQYYGNSGGYGVYMQPSHIIKTMAIVEYEDGTVHEVLPQEIRFIDGKVKEYDFKTT